MNLWVESDFAEDFEYIQAMLDAYVPGESFLGLMTSQEDLFGAVFTRGQEINALFPTNPE